MVGLGELVALAGLDGDEVLVPMGDAGGMYLVVIGKLELQVGGYLVLLVASVGKYRQKEISKYSPTKPERYQISK